MKLTHLILLSLLITAVSCTQSAEEDGNRAPTGAVKDDSNEGDMRTIKQAQPGVEMIAVEDNKYRVFTQRMGEGDIKLLTLHGGPGMTHEYFENFPEHLNPEGIQVIFYDQLGSYYSDQPDDSRLWVTERFVEELETVRKGLGLSDFYAVGNSWGGLLLMEYALKYPQHLKGIIISNMSADIGKYQTYVNKLKNQLPAAIVARMNEFEAKEDFDNAEYQQLLLDYLYTKHVCRVTPFPDPVNRAFEHLNPNVYVAMNGNNEFIINGNLRDWSRLNDLHRITLPTLLISGQYDTMNPADIAEMGRRIPKSRVVICPNGSHLSMWDDTEFYFDAVKKFIADVENNRFNQRAK
jgi:proline iminopeptidase